MNKKILSKVFYTSVQNPEDIKCIEVEENDNLKIINSFVKRIVNKKLKKPTISEPQFSEETLTKFMEKGLNTNAEEVKILFESLSRYLYGRAKGQEKYWCLIISEEYFFIYHFTPDRAVSFEENNILEFIKYLDDSSILKFIFKLKSDSVVYYFEKLSEEELVEIQSETRYVYGIFDKSRTKGMKKLLGEEPEYEFKGELRVRIKRSDKTDIVVETFLEDLENINSNIIFDFQRGWGSIKIEKGPITELFIDGIPYDFATGLKRIKYEKLGISEFMEKYRFYKNNSKVREFKEYVIVGDKRVDKPEKIFEGKEETIFIFEKSIDNYENLIDDSFNAIRNNFNIAFVELNGFNANYDEVNIGHLAIFARFKNDKRIKTVSKVFGNMINNVSGNLTLEKTLHYVGLLVLTEFLKSKGFKEKLHLIGKKSLSDYYLNMSDKNIELKEIDKLGIEFKAGIKNDKQGFFDPSPKKFSEKLLKKIKKREEMTIFFVGINEDTKDFSAIPLNRIRNEFHESVKEFLSQNGVNLLLSETVPISENEGILIMVLQRGGKNNEES